MGTALVEELGGQLLDSSLVVGDRLDVDGASLDHVWGADVFGMIIDEVASDRMDQDGDAFFVVDIGESVEELLLLPRHDVSVSEVDVSEVYVYNVDGDAGF